MFIDNVDTVICRPLKFRLSAKKKIRKNTLSIMPMIYMMRSTRKSSIEPINNSRCSAIHLSST